MIVILLISAILIINGSDAFLEDINIPDEHITYFFNTFPEARIKCLESENCRFKSWVGKKACWGYERDCNTSQSYHVRPRCPGDHKGWVQTKDAQYETFYTQADFGMLSSRVYIDRY